jgi:hypothetical protein
MRSAACSIFIGPDDLGAWTRLEMGVALNRAATEPDFRVFPVLLPGLDPFEPADLPPFLATRTWVHLRDGPDSARRLQELVNAVHGVPFGTDIPTERPDGPSPYQGLEVFDERHAPFYFGREAYVQRLVEKLKSSRFVAVVGPSGSGKSSLVRAGLLPRMRIGAAGGSWRILVLRPGAHPLAALAGQLVNPTALIHQTSRGYPRAVNNLALQALVAAFAADKAIVDESSTRAAVAEVTAE